MYQCSVLPNERKLYGEKFRELGCENIVYADVVLIRIADSLKIIVATRKLLTIKTSSSVYRSDTTQNKLEMFSLSQIRFPTKVRRARDHERCVRMTLEFRLHF